MQQSPRGRRAEAKSCAGLAAGAASRQRPTLRAACFFRGLQPLPWLPRPLSLRDACGGKRQSSSCFAAF